jgi:hypothetical protein
MVSDILDEIQTAMISRKGAGEQENLANKTRLQQENDALQIFKNQEMVR